MECVDSFHSCQQRYSDVNSVLSASGVGI